MVMFEVELQIQSGAPIYEQLYRRISQMILQGLFQKEERLPSVRELAKSLGLNPNTVAKAYAVLEREGVIMSLPGKGYFVSASSESAAESQILEDFRHAAVQALEAGAKVELLREVLDQAACFQQKQHGEQKQ